MSRHLVFTGRKEINREYEEYIELKLLCEKLKVEYPAELKMYFKDYIEELPSVILEEFMNFDTPLPYTALQEDGKQGFSLEVAKIPKEVKTLRVYLT